MATLTVHDKAAEDDPFLECLPLIENGARDERNFVKKAVSCALRSIGKRGLDLNAAATEVAERLAASNEPSCRWVGKDALREIASAKVRTRLKRLPQDLKYRLANWGYASADAAVRSFVEPTLRPPATFPYPGGVG